MSRRHYNLPPLTALSAFEAAARHQSFKDAAQELSVTPGAVSHQIKSLEMELGAVLFLRQHRGVSLTTDGKALFDTLSTSFRRIAKRLDVIREGDTRDKITVGSTTAVAAMWLAPAIIRFWRDFPDISVDQLTQDTPFTPRSELDFIIRYGRDPNTRLTQTMLYRDVLVPVSAPQTASRLQDVSLAELAAQTLVYLDSDGRDWTTWPDWFRQMGHTGDLSKGIRVTSYSVALQQASKGAGLVLGWRRLVQPLIDAGDLAVIGKHTMPAPRAFYLVEYAQDDLSANAATFKNWILSEVPEHSH